MRKPDLKTTRWGVILFTLCFLSGWLGTKIRAITGFSALIWMPSGIGLSALVLGGAELWPWIFLAGFFLGVARGTPLGDSVLIGAGSAFECYLAAYFLKRFCPRKPTLTRVNEVLVFFLLAVGLSALLSSTLEVSALYWVGNIPPDRLFRVWQAWWMGSALGNLIIAGMVISFWNDVRFRLKTEYRLNWEMVALFLGVVTVSVFNFTSLAQYNHTLLFKPFILYPLMLLAALRFDIFGATTFNVLVAIIIVIGTLSGFVPFTLMPVEDRMVLLQIYALLLGITGLVLAAAVREKEVAVSLSQLNESRLHQVIEAAPNGLVMINQKGKIVLCNAQIELLFQHSRRDLEGKSIEVLIPERFSENHPEARQMGAGRNLTGLRKDGTEFPVEIGLNPVQTDQGPFVLASIVDITERKAIEQKLHDAIHTRDEFMSIASHELKTPLTSLSLQIQMAKLKINPETETAPSAEKLAKIFEVSGKQVNRLTGLVEDLLDVSRIQTGKFNFTFEQTNLSEVVKEMTGRMSEQFAKAKISSTVDIDPDVWGSFDHLRMEQVIDNLLSNVIKYAPGASVKVSLKKEKNRVKLTVEDHGPGIPREKQSKLFNRFERATNLSNVTGLGLGLFIVKEIVQGHSGSVKMESAVGEGTKFVVDLPLDGMKLATLASNEAPNSEP